MTYLTLSTIKKQLNIDSSFTDDDTYLTTLGDVVEQIVAKHLESDLAEIASDNDGALPAPIVHAMLLLLATLYMSREHVTFSQSFQIPVSCSNAYDYLLSPYISYKKSAR